MGALQLALVNLVGKQAADLLQTKVITACARSMQLTRQRKLKFTVSATVSCGRAGGRGRLMTAGQNKHYRRAGCAPQQLWILAQLWIIVPAGKGGGGGVQPTSEMWLSCCFTRPAVCGSKGAHTSQHRRTGYGHRRYKPASRGLENSSRGFGAGMLSVQLIASSFAVEVAAVLTLRGWNSSSSMPLYLMLPLICSDAKRACGERMHRQHRICI